MNPYDLWNKFQQEGRIDTEQSIGLLKVFAQEAKAGIIAHEAKRLGKDIKIEISKQTNAKYPNRYIRYIYLQNEEWYRNIYELTSNFLLYDIQFSWKEIIQALNFPKLYLSGLRTGGWL